MNQITHDIYDGFEPWPLNVYGWHSDAPIFRRLIEETRPKQVLEVGSWVGASAIHMAECAKAAGLDTKILCVDSFSGAPEFWTKYAGEPDRDLKLKHGYPQIYFQFLSNVVHSGFASTILPFPVPSSIGLRVLREKGFKADLIYVDASHEKEDVAHDLRGCYPLLPKTGGVIFGDDWSWPGGLKDAVKDFANFIGKPVTVDGEHWIIRI